MQRIHMVACASAAVIGGAVMGATTNTTPLQRGLDGWDHVPRYELTAADLEANARTPPPPDHYPLITPQGRIEVAELRDHGLYRNRRFGMSSGWYEPREEPSYEVVAADYRYIPDDFADDYSPPSRAAASPTPTPQEQPVVLAANAEPLETLATGAPPAPPVTPRTIDVASALGSRR